MEDISLHILDVVENALNAGATLVEIQIEDDPAKDLLTVRIRDNGAGMEPGLLEEACNPFFTTRTTRRVGLGLSMFKQAAVEAGGEMMVDSEPGKGTEVKATFQRDHIDRKPMGDLSLTMVSLIAGNPDVDFLFASDWDGKEICLDTREIRAVLDEGTPLNSPPILKLIKGLFGKA
jgi:anti-sigma regulatory factor (Ser/Thr protein kinase)